MVEQINEKLAENPLFIKLSPEIRLEVAKVSYFTSFEKEEVLIKQKKNLEYLYLLLSGIVSGTILITKPEIDINRVPKELISNLRKMKESFQLDLQTSCRIISKGEFTGSLRRNP